MSKSVLGLIGLGVMGKNISLNIADKGFAISIYNRTEKGEENIVDDFIKKYQSLYNMTGFTELSDFVKSLEKPRNIFLMIKAGKAIDQIIEKLLPLLADGDIIIDGGNSKYNDTRRRNRFLFSKNINFIGCGISGGVDGARNGASIMPGGNKSSYEKIAPVLKAIAAKDTNGQPCCTFIGPDGAGHFIKMVHNGIEYVEMQLLAELYGIMSISINREEISDVFTKWNNGKLSNYLLEITIDILNKKEGCHYLLDFILDKADNKGTGSWSSKAALELGTANTMMASAVFARYISSFKEKRKQLSTQRLTVSVNLTDFDLKALEKAYHFARVINHHQGFDLIQVASKTFDWDLNLSEIARIWTNGCIIKSKFMVDCITYLSNCKTLLDDQDLITALSQEEEATLDIIKFGISNRVALNSFCSAYNYWIAMSTENLPANLIQAQRDYFGAHTYQRNDDLSLNNFHTIWK